MLRREPMTLARKIRYVGSALMIGSPVCVGLVPGRLLDS